jgi:hypothetical protein
MIVTPRTRFVALALTTVLVTAAPASFAQTSPTPSQTDQDHSAHHPGSDKEQGAKGPSHKSPAGRGDGMGMGMMGEGGMMGGDMGQMMSMMRGMMTMMSARSGMIVSHVEGRIASLKTELNITDAQKPQWDRFADALRATAKSMNSMFRPRMMQSDGDTTLPAQLERRQEMLSAHLADLKAFKNALDPLYASFSDEQKKVADKLMIGPMGMM